MLSFATCADVPVRGGRGGGDGGLVEVEGRVVWGGDEGVYMLDEVRSKWSRVADGAVVHGDMVFVMGGVGMDRAVWCADIRDLQSIWRQLPDVPYCWSSVCVGDGVLLAIGGAEDLSGSKKTSSIYGLHGDDKKWKHVGDMPFACSRVDTLLLSDGGLLVVDGITQQVLRITVQGLAKLFPITPTVKETGKSQKEADERLYEEAMSKGYVETSVTKCLILGAAGVGKTHLKHLLLKKDPPEQRVSTGLADNPVRAISFSLAGVGGQAEDDWFVVEDDQALLRVVGGTIRDGGVSMATSLDEVVSSFPKMPIHVSSDGAGAVHPDPTPARVNTYHGYRPTEQDCIHRGGADSSHQPLLSGGQLQYHDILPLFIQKPAVAIFVLNLSEELSHQPTIEYYGADGKPDARPLIITVGTHRDAADRCSESIAEKSQKLKALLDAGSFRIVYNGEELEEVIFAVNGKTPQDVDRRVAKWSTTTSCCIVRLRGVAAKGDLVKFRDHGLLSVELLNKFSKHYSRRSVHCTRSVEVIVAIKRACGILKYQGVLFEDAFMCAGASCTSNAPHLATVVSKKKWKCSIRGHQRGDLCEGQLMWFGESGVMKQDPSAAGTVPVTLDSEPSLQHLMEKVAAVIPHKYEMVGLQLGLTLAQLQAIRPQHQSLGDYHRAFRYFTIFPDDIIPVCTDFTLPEAWFGSNG
eukprot:Em0002g244a